MTTHTPYSPSGAPIWIECPTQPAMEAAVEPLPEDDTASREGTAAHWAMAQLMAGITVGRGEFTPDGEVISDEMVEGAQLFVDTCTNLGKRMTVRPMWHVEEFVPGPAGRGGTPDAWLHDVNANVLYVLDYKFGHGIVEVFENWQLLEYAGLLLQRLKIDANRTRVVMVVVQPRAFHRDGTVRSWDVGGMHLRDYWHRLDMAAEDGMSGHAKARPNRYCGYCRARHACPALQADAYRAADLAQQALPLVLGPAAVGLELSMLTDAAKRLHARIEGLATQGEAMARTGTLVPGWVMEDAPGREVWTDARRAIQLAKTCGLDISKPEASITPAQARQAGMPAALVAHVSGRPKAGKKFARLDESLARRIFS